MMPLGRDYVQQAVAQALQELGVGRLAVALLHWPGDVPSGKLQHGAPLPACAAEEGGSWRRCRVESYAALLGEQAEGRVGAVGVSNFAIRHLDDLAAERHSPPAVHQMELHPLWHDDALLERTQRDATQVQAYGCLGSVMTGATLLRQEGFQKIA